MTTLYQKEIQIHNSINDCWINLNGKIYDVTKFLEEHPGGDMIILKYGG